MTDKEILFAQNDNLINRILEMVCELKDNHTEIYEAKTIEDCDIKVMRRNKARYVKIYKLLIK